MDFRSGSTIQYLLNNSDLVIEGYGLSVRSILILGDLLDCQDPIVSKNSSRICIEQIYEFSKSLIDTLAKVSSDDYPDLATEWYCEIEKFYNPEPESFRSRRTGRLIWQYYAEYQHEHYNIEYFYNKLIEIDELLVYSNNGNSLYFMVEY